MKKFLMVLALAVGLTACNGTMLNRNDGKDKLDLVVEFWPEKNFKKEDLFVTADKTGLFMFLERKTGREYMCIFDGELIVTDIKYCRYGAEMKTAK
jgi:hypothetical protein